MNTSKSVENLFTSKGDHEIPAVICEFMSDDSLEVVRHFGLEAPKLLNNYSNALEDALIQQVEIVKQLRAEIEALKAN